MEKNDALKAQSENGDALGGLSTEEIERLENYYILEAERLMAFGVQEKKEPLEVMLKHLRIVENLLHSLQFQWEDSISVLYSSFMHYVVLVEGKEKQNRLSDLVIELIKKMKYLSKKEPLIMGLARQYQQQRKEVEALIGLRSNEPEMCLSWVKRMKVLFLTGYRESNKECLRKISI